VNGILEAICHTLLEESLNLFEKLERDNVSTSQPIVGGPLVVWCVFSSTLQTVIFIL
jgi:hypothetical protein